MQPPTAEELLQILWRRKLWVLVPLLLGVIGGLTAIRMTQPMYRASAEILIEPPKVAEGLVKSITTLSVEDRLEAVRKHITARERIERLVEDLDLYAAIPAQQLDEAVQRLRGALVVKVGADKSVRIELSGTDPDQVAAAVNRLAEDYVAQNSALRDVESGGTVDFMESQLTDSKSELEAIEARITQFKSENLMRLPEQRESHMRAVEGLTAKREANGVTIRSIEARLALLRQGVRPAEPSQGGQAPADTLLEQRRQDLRSLRRDFTDQHPDVIRLKREVAALEEEAARAPRAHAATVPDVPVDPRLMAEIAQLNFQIEDLKNDQRQIEANISRYRSYLEQMPTVEQQLLILEREYDNLVGFYGQNLKRRTEIGVAEDLEKGDLREAVSILERAYPPSAPFSPNKPLLMIMALGIGGALGLGLALLAENIGGGFEGPAELRRAFPGVRVLDPIPRIRAATVEIPPADSHRRSA